MIYRSKVVNSCIVLIVVLMLGVSAAKAVETSEIDETRQKTILNELDENDSQVIDQFVAEAMDELVGSNNFSDIVDARIALASRRLSQQDSAQVQYGPLFSGSVQEYLLAALKKSEQLPESKQKDMIILNLMILANDMENAEVAAAALGMTQDKNVMIRYWAVHALTNVEIIEQLNTVEIGDGRLARAFADKLEETMRTESSSDIIAMTAVFAAGLKTTDGRELLIQIAENRIDKYADWSVKDELLDATVLKALAERILADGEGRSRLARMFGQLYSYVIQRYIMGNESFDDRVNQQLVSVIVGTEKRLLGKLVPGMHGSITRAIEKGKISLLSSAHDSLLGTTASDGRLAIALGFGYGKDQNGRSLSAPLPLPRQPEPTVK